MPLPRFQANVDIPHLDSSGREVATTPRVAGYAPPLTDDELARLEREHAEAGPVTAPRIQMERRLVATIRRLQARVAEDVPVAVEVRCG